jgi:AAA15 family ATPase/GTPase
MIKTFEIRNFRCFRELKLSSIERVNLITGVNNVGKTCLLEALFLFSGAYNPELTITVNALRGLDKYKLEVTPWAETPWDSLFKDFNISDHIEIIGENDLTGKRILHLRIITEEGELRKISKIIKIPIEKPDEISSSLEYAKVLELESIENKKSKKFYSILYRKGFQSTPISPPPPFPGFMLTDRFRLSFKDQAERLGKLELYGKQEELLGALKLIEPRLKRLTIITIAEEPIIHGDIGFGRLIPLPLMGGGMVRLAGIILTIGVAEKGIVIIDEIENGIHHAFLPKFWQAILEAARTFNTQVFATTHSRECIVEAHKVFSESHIYDFRLHRLERKKDDIYAINYKKDNLERAIETGFEVR